MKLFYLFANSEHFYTLKTFQKIQLTPESFVSSFYGNKIIFQCFRELDSIKTKSKK